MKYLGPEQRGSRDSVTASRNTYGQYYRDRVQPDQTATARRTATRSAMATIAAAWAGTLTQTQRDAWNALAARLQEQDTLGQTIKLSGFQWFVRYNLNVFASVAPVVQTDPPPPPGPLVPDIRPTGVWQTSPYIGTEFAWTNGDPFSNIVWQQSALPVSAGASWLPGRGNWWQQCWGAGANGSPVFVQIAGISSGQRVALRWRQKQALLSPSAWQSVVLVRP